MIVDGRVTDYIVSLESGHGELCDEIARKAVADNVPIIRKETASLLQTLVASVHPGKILEVGTAVGYSALLMSQVMPADCHITTIEKYEKRIPVAKANFKRGGAEDRITLLAGDADEILSSLAALGNTYDLIFMDAAKGQYIHWLPMVIKLLSQGGMLISDNVLQDGDIVESRYAVERRNRTIHSRMRDYLYTIKHMEELVTSVVPIGDGVTISVRVK